VENLADRIVKAREELAHLLRIYETATCSELGCDMQHVGGANCGCEFEIDQDGEKRIIPGCCSVPVLRCTRCGDSDYGDNAEAKETREKCHEKMSWATDAPVPIEEHA
jgi:hypothetical protein